VRKGLQCAAAFCAAAFCVFALRGEPSPTEAARAATLAGWLTATLEKQPAAATPPMRFSPSWGRPDGTAWPFDVSTLARAFGRNLTRGADGLMHLRTAQGLPLGKDGLVTAAASAAYANRTVMEWAVLQLDARYPRCDARTVRALATCRMEREPDYWTHHAILFEKGLMRPPAGGGWAAAWKLAGNYHFLIVSDAGAPFDRVDYQFVLWDGKRDWPLASFHEFPTPERAQAVLRVLDDGAACNDLAVLVDRGEVNRTLADPEYSEMLLRQALSRGDVTAAWNLGVLYERRGEKELARAFYARASRTAENPDAASGK